MKFIRTNLLGFVAIFIALSGSAYSAHKVTSRDIANGTIRSSDLSSKLRSKIFLGASASGPVAGPRGLAGADGSTGPTGAKGEDGASGNNDFARVVQTIDHSVDVALACPDGFLGAMGFTDAGDVSWQATASGVTFSTGRYWGPWPVTLIAICVRGIR